MPRTRTTHYPDSTITEIENEPTSIVKKRNRRTFKVALNQEVQNLDVSSQVKIDLNSTGTHQIITRSRGHDLDISKIISFEIPRKKSRRPTKLPKTLNEQIDDSQENIGVPKKIAKRKIQHKALKTVIQKNDSFSSSDKENIEIKSTIQKKKKKNVSDKNHDDLQQLPDSNFENPTITKIFKKNSKRKGKNVAADKKPKDEELNLGLNTSKDTTFHSLNTSEQVCDKSDESFNSLNDTLPVFQTALPQNKPSLSIILNDSILDKPSSTMMETYIENEKQKMKGKRLPLSNIRISGIEELMVLNTSEIPVLQRESTYIKEDQSLHQNGSRMRDESTYTKEEEDDKTIYENANTLCENSKKHVFEPANACSIFKSQNSLRGDTSIKTPPRSFHHSPSWGSVGRTPIPKKSKSQEINLTTDGQPDSTPKSKPRVLNVTHSMEKSEDNHYVKETKSKSISCVKFTSPSSQKLPFTQNISNIIKSNLKGSNKTTIVNKENPKQNLKKNRGISKLPKRTKIQISEAKSKQIAKIIESSYKVTPSKGSVTKLVQPVSRTKMPNFASLHKKQFDRMESLVQNKARKEERARQLFVPPTLNQSKGAKTRESPMKKLPQNNMPPPKSFTRFGFKIDDAEKFKSLPIVNYKDSPRPKITTPYRSASKSQIKNIVMKDSSTTSMKKDYISKVRTNRRFDLQMKARNMLSST